MEGRHCTSLLLLKLGCKTSTATVFVLEKARQALDAVIEPKPYNPHQQSAGLKYY
jgi:hypothetical protein